MKGKSSKNKKWHLRSDLMEGLLEKKTFEQGSGEGRGGGVPSPWISGGRPGNGCTSSVPETMRKAMWPWHTCPSLSLS